MLANKWFLFAISAAIGFCGLAAGLDWTSVLSPQAAGFVVAALAGLKMILNAVAPAPRSTVTSTDNTIITHTST
jgi:hypothetical protein